jgi:hypothetical protein
MTVASNGLLEGIEGSACSAVTGKMRLLPAIGPDRRCPIKAGACRAPRFAAGGLDRPSAVRRKARRLSRHHASHGESEELREQMLAASA